MARVSIIEWITKKLRSLTGIVEDGDTATHAISAGKYVIWKGNPCKASSAISIGDALSSSNLTALTDGVCNDVVNTFNSKMPIFYPLSRSNITQSATIDNWSIDFPQKTGYTRHIIEVNTTSSNAIFCRYDTTSAVVSLYIRNMAGSSITFDITGLGVYIPNA